MCCSCYFYCRKIEIKIKMSKKLFFCMNKVSFIVLEWNMVTIVLYTSKEHKKPLPKLFLLFSRLIDDMALKSSLKASKKLSNHQSSRSGFSRLTDYLAWNKLAKSFQKASKKLSSHQSSRSGFIFQHNDPLNYLWLF